MRRRLITRLVPLALLALFAAGAVPARSSSLSVPRHVGVSLHRVWMQPGAAVRPAPAATFPLRVADPAAYRREKAAADAAYARWLRAHPTATSMSRETRPLTSISGSLNHTGFAASDETKAGTPPDTTGAAGPDNYVEMVNSSLAVYSKTDLTTPTQTMDEPNFLGVPGTPVCDGNIEWDQQGGRWLYVAVVPCDGNASDFGLAFGWSKSTSPDLTPSNWCQYTMDSGPHIEDYPKLGHDDSQILIGTNQFGSDGIFSKIFVLDKPANGDTNCPDTSTEESTAAVLTVGKRSKGGPWTPVAANLADSSPVGYVVATDLDYKHLHLFTVGRDSNQANVLLDSKTIPVPQYCLPLSIPQKGSTHTLESLDARLTQAVAVTDPNTGKEGIWTQHTISGACLKRYGLPYGPSVVRWYELTPGATTTTQMGTVRGKNGAFAFMGAISPSSDGQNAAIFYNSSSGKTLPEFRVRDRHLATTGGVMTEDLLLATSTSADADRSCLHGFGLPCRWGDYNGASPDPSDPSLVWGTGELTVEPPYTGTHAAQWGSDNAAIDVTPAATYGLAVTVTDTRAGTGSVSSTPSGIDVCTSSCSFAYSYATPVQLVATPGPHSVFRWYGDCSGSGVCNLPMGSPENVSVTFAPQPEKLSYTKLGKGSGTVTFYPRGHHCASRCAVTFDYGTHVRMTATAAPGSVFRGWSGACHGRLACRVTMDAAKSVTANFARR